MGVVERECAHPRLYGASSSGTQPRVRASSAQPSRRRRSTLVVVVVAVADAPSPRFARWFQAGKRLLGSASGAGQAGPPVGRKREAGGSVTLAACSAGSDSQSDVAKTNARGFDLGRAKYARAAWDLRCGEVTPTWLWAHSAGLTYVPLTFHVKASAMRLSSCKTIHHCRLRRGRRRAQLNGRGREENGPGGRE